MIAVVDFVVEHLEVHLLMEVSAKKSKVLSGRAAIAVAVANGVRCKKVSPTSHAKLLGIDTVGGRRRSTITFQHRLQAFSNIVPRFQAIRRTGVNSKQMVRAAGPPAILYGCEVMGISDSALSVTRGRVAAAAAPAAGGKNPDRTLYALDGNSGTLDPAFEAHTSPLKFWALAHWEGWFTQQQMSEAFAEASLKLEQCKGSWWSAVAGPTTALLASLNRLGWCMPSSAEAVDDLGFTWSFIKDSPAALVAAGRESVRRWRLLRAGEAIPGLILASCDVGDPWPSGGTILCDFSMLLAPFLNAAGSGAATCENWCPQWRGDLASAISGGQWPQTRKAAVPNWGIEDSRCQLCLSGPARNATWSG